MPPGSFDRSLRSSASSAVTEIFVRFAISLSDIPRSSRARFNWAPRSSIRGRGNCNRDTQGFEGAEVRGFEGWYAGSKAGSWFEGWYRVEGWYAGSNVQLALSPKP